MKTRSTILSLAALATLSVSALAPTQASAWGSGDGYGFGAHRTMDYFGRSFRPRSSAFESCSTESAPTFRRSYTPRPRFTEEIPVEHETFETRGYASAPQPYGYAPMRQAQGYAPAEQMQGYGPSQPQFHVPEPHGQRGFAQARRGHSYEEAPEFEPQAQQQANPDNGPAGYSSKELQ